MNLMIVPGILVCSSFLISVCMFIVSKATVLFTVCSAVTVECCVLYPCVCLVCLLLCKEEGSSSVSAITERRDMGLYEVPLSMRGIILVLRAVFNMLVRNASPKGPMYFRCLMFNLSGPCVLLFLLCFIASWT